MREMSSMLPSSSLMASRWQAHAARMKNHEGCVRGAADRERIRIDSGAIPRGRRPAGAGAARAYQVHVLLRLQPRRDGRDVPHVELDRERGGLAGVPVRRAVALVVVHDEVLELRRRAPVDALRPGLGVRAESEEVRPQRVVRLALEEHAEHRVRVVRRRGAAGGAVRVLGGVAAEVDGDVRGVHRGGGRGGGGGGAPPLPARRAGAAAERRARGERVHALRAADVVRVLHLRLVHVQPPSLPLVVDALLLAPQRALPGRQRAIAAIAGSRSPRGKGRTDGA